ncbi:Flp family type IVb pilin [Frateuria sp. Soil773]|uniref:Flp family type IVb pilin n=1 Tax=Frateuria sp. Soil773 TaxID=1736407 RepID=UPI000B02E63D|nr:Flp family type IVb pilin [Frateuria sp. Soil773]
MNMSIRRFLREEDGITALEYGILAALIVSIIAVTFVPAIQTVFDTVVTKLKTALGIS